MTHARARIAGIDIDGVLADPAHRLHHLAHRPKNWRRFFAEVDGDQPLAEGLDLVNDLQAEGVVIMYVSGRPEYLRKATLQWLARHGFPDAPMYLRAPRDHRPAAQVKLELYSRLDEEFDIGVIVDDDDAVVSALRAAGLPVRHADWCVARPDQQEALIQAQEREGRT